MPKGHLEPGETAEVAAIREVQEETGIISHVIATLGTIDFWFKSQDRRIHKTVHHYLLEADGGELSDADVEVVQVAWIPLDEISGLLRYPDERRLVGMVPGLLALPES
jgi:ADP-ribose pyrophosphatase YjhB (NUDIX family)